MNLRLSTNLLHQQGMTQLINQQSRLAAVQKQLTSGSRISQGKDDPAAMAASQRLDHAISTLNQFARNSDRLQSRLEIQDTALSDANGVMTRALELAIQANNTSMSDADRQAISFEIRTLRESMVAIANRDDGNGRALFAGSQDGVRPFNANQGTVSYSGNDGQIAMDIGLDLAVKDTNPGSVVFMRVRNGDGVVTQSAGTANTGSGVLGNVNVVNSATWGGTPLTVRFTAADAYEVVDGGGNALTPPVTGTWAQGQTITARGVDFSVTGRPAAGDTFSIAPSSNQDIFATLQKLADATSIVSTTPAGQAQLANELRGSIASIRTAQEHLLTLRADTGARLSAIEMAAEARASDTVSLAQNLSELKDTDFTEAVSKLTLQLQAMDAAQATIVKLQGMSLFDRL